MANSNIGCSQQDLYTGARIEWSLYNDRWEDFAEYSPLYTETYGDERLAEIDAAERLLDKAAREAIATGILRELSAINKDALHLYAFFKSYVLRIYDPSVQDLKLAAIGDGYFKKANAGNRGSTSALLNQATPFLEDNLKELMSKNVIPTAFPDKMVAITKAFKDKYAESLAADKAVVDATKEKNDANSAVFGHVADLNKVAQIIYKKDQDSAKLFVWVTVLSQTHGVRNAGVSGKVTIDGTKTAVGNVKMTIKEVDKATLTDPKTGRYIIAPLSSGEYTMLIEMDGYAPQTILFKVVTGVVTRLNVSLVAIVPT